MYASSKPQIHAHHSFNAYLCWQIWRTFLTCLQLAHYSYRLLGWKVAPGIASRLATARVQEAVAWAPDGPAATLALAGGPRMLCLPDAAREVQKCTVVMAGSCPCSWQHICPLGQPRLLPSWLGVAQSLLLRLANLLLSTWKYSGLFSQ